MCAVISNENIRTAWVKVCIFLYNVFVPFGYSKMGAGKREKKNSNGRNANGHHQQQPHQQYIESTSNWIKTQFLRPQMNNTTKFDMKF